MHILFILVTIIFIAGKGREITNCFVTNHIFIAFVKCYGKFDKLAFKFFVLSIEFARLGRYTIFKNLLLSKYSIKIHVRLFIFA